MRPSSPAAAKPRLRRQEVALVEFCPHHTDYNGLCALCGEDVTLYAATTITAVRSPPS